MRYRLVLASLAVLVGCSKDAPPSSAGANHTAGAATVSGGKDPAAARQLIASGAAVLDVRTPAEYVDDHLARATNIPVDELGGRLAEIERLVDGDKTKPLVVYCASGNRSRRAQAQLQAAGFTHVMNGGGIDDVR